MIAVAVAMTPKQEETSYSTYLHVPADICQLALCRMDSAVFLISVVSFGRLLGQNG